MIGDSRVVQHLDMDTLRRNADWYQALGVGLIVLGVLAIIVPFFSTVTVTLLAGVFFTISGIMYLVHSFRSRKWGRFILELIVGAAYFLLGLFLLSYPLRGIFTLTLLLSAFFAVQGLLKIINAVRLHPVSNWGWALVSGVISLLLGVVIYFGMPFTAFWVVGVIIGVDLICNGFAMLMLASPMRSAYREHKVYCIGNVCYSVS